MCDVLSQYVRFLWTCFQYDMGVFSQAWLYAWLLVPAFCYLMFFVVKWAVLTLPLWLPFVIVIGAFKSEWK